MDDLNDEKDRLLYEVEQFLIRNESSDYLHYFLRFNYGIIRSGEVILILAPIDAALQRLVDKTGKSLEQIFNSYEGKDVLTNFLSSRRMQSEVPVYLAINGAYLKSIYDLARLDGPRDADIPIPSIQLEDLSVRTVDGIINMPGQLERLSQTNSSMVISLMRSNIIGDGSVTGFDDLPNPIVRKIVLDLSLADILNKCNINTRFNSSICDSEDFWNEKTRKDYPNYQNAVEGTWKNTYMYLADIITYYGIYLNRDMYEGGIMKYTTEPEHDLIVRGGPAVQLTRPTKFNRTLNSNRRGIAERYSFPYQEIYENRYLGYPDVISNKEHDNTGYNDIEENGNIYQFTPFFVHGLPRTVGIKVWAAYSNWFHEYYLYVGIDKESLARLFVDNYDRFAERLGVALESDDIPEGTGEVYDPNIVEYNTALTNFWSTKDDFEEQVKLIPFTRESLYNFVLNHDYFNLRNSTYGDEDEEWVFFQIEF